MKLIRLGAIGLLCGWFGGGIAIAGEATPGTNAVTRKVGVYDSRAIAVAFASSKIHEDILARLKAERDKAQAEGNQQRVRELEERGQASQQLMHEQGFSTAPVDNILDHVKSELPGLLRKTGVETFVSKWDEATLKKYDGVERVDVTMALVELFKPNERALRNALEIQKRAPIPLEEVRKHRH